MKRIGIAASTALVALLSLASRGVEAAAAAQDDADDAAASLEELEQQFEQFEEAADRQAEESARRIDVRGLAGVQAYTGDAAGLVSPGAAYGVALGYDTTALTEIELSYQGAALATQAGVGERRPVMENGGQAIIKFAPRLPRLEPYAFGGVGVSRLNVVGGDAAAAVRDDTLVKLPVGLGLDYRLYSGERADVLLGARGTYGFVLDDEAFQTATDLTNEGRFTLQIGTAF